MQSVLCQQPNAAVVNVSKYSHLAIKFHRLREQNISADLYMKDCWNKGHSVHLVRYVEILTQIDDSDERMNHRF